MVWSTMIVRASQEAAHGSACRLPSLWSWSLLTTQMLVQDGKAPGRRHEHPAFAGASILEWAGDSNLSEAPDARPSLHRVAYRTKAILLSQACICRRGQGRGSRPSLGRTAPEPEAAAGRATPRRAAPPRHNARTPGI